MLFPHEPTEFWDQIRTIIREEISKNQQQLQTMAGSMETPGLKEKPLFKIEEICSIFNVTRPTIYEWIKHGKLKRIKIRSRVYFLGRDIRQLIQT